MTLLVFLLAFITFLLAALNLLPLASDLPSGITTGFILVVGYIKAWDSIFAFTELFQAVAFVAAVYTIIFIWHVVIKIIGWVRGGTS